METKHMKNMNKPFICKICDYSCNKKFLLEQHFNTKKHKSRSLETLETKNMKNMKFIIKESDSEQLTCNVCMKEFKSRNGLWKHKKKCMEITPKPKEQELSHQNTSYLVQLIKDNEQMRKLLLEQQQQMNVQQQQIGEMIPKMGNNNNTINQKFNLNVFLNEECKDAINIRDFIESLQIQLSDLEHTKTHGLVESISHLLINGLNELDLYKRPIHCTDPKRDILYIKDDIWGRDDENDKMRNTINELANKQRMAMKEWTNAHPNWQNDEILKDEYVKLLHELMEPLEKTEKEQNRIIKKVSNATIIGKEDE